MSQKNGASMFAWFSGDSPGVDNLAFLETAIPTPDETTLLVQVTHVALNFSDLLMVADQYQVRPPRPFIAGQELVGVVESASKDSKFKPGDTIASKVLWGGFAQYALVREDMAILVPDGFNPAQAAALPVSYITALVALDYCAHVGASDTVLIHAAAGGIGLAAVEIARARGATIIATASTSQRLELARAHGAHHGVNYRKDDWVQRIKDLTDGRGANVILDPVGGEIGEDSQRCIAVDGKLLIVGFSSGKMPKLAPHRLLLKRASAIGVYWNHDTDHEMLIRIQASLETLIRSGKINPEIDDRYKFTELPAALDDLANRRASGKMVLQVSQGAAP